ncbi:conserved hypothetical protein [Neospora caninum Liverpool]|uniref:Uncharacterized protein n=1 Tax=Neospora caninum (strain Liverpool) TaxID=572307 RepID=F0VRU5_NEOCL|nr:conserved hypothetical protein [Neospora caninum Liverpool]CBZ56443.1 conserved hypothetical protein [Neospora caninum Liverpool]|eukprot:XP_003886468.1 conserved hypothetical protein [Neospora caninum Liverpool]
MSTPVAVSPPFTLVTPTVPPPPTTDLASLSARNAGVCCFRNNSSLPILSFLHNEADSLKSAVRTSTASGGGVSPRATGLRVYEDPAERHPQRLPHISRQKTQITLPAAYGSTASSSHSRHTRPDVAGVIHRYERIFHARLSHGLHDPFGNVASSQSSGSSHPRSSSVTDPFHASFVPVAGLSGDYPVNLSRHGDVQEVYPNLSSFLDTAAVRHSLQLTASLRFDKDARQWHLEREDLLRELRRIPPLHIDEALGEAGARTCRGTLTNGDLSALPLKRIPPLLQNPVLTAPEYRLIKFLSVLQHRQFPVGSPRDTKLPLHVLLQLPGTVVSAGVAMLEGNQCSSISIESEAEQLQLQLSTGESLPVSSLCQVPEGSCHFFSRRQRQHFAALFRQIMGCCRLLIHAPGERAARDGTTDCSFGPEKRADDTTSGGFLRALAGNSLAALEQDRQELEEDRLAWHRETGDGESAEDGRDALWWRAVYYAFRTGDLKCLIALGAGDFLPPGGCTFRQACEALQAAALEPADSECQREAGKESNAPSDRGGSLPPQPPLLPFVCRHLLSLVLSSSVEANRRNLPDVAVNEEERKNVAEMLAALPSAASLRPPSLSVILGRLLLLYPPENVAIGETNRTTQKHTRRAKDPYLPLLLSLINPTMWPPVNAAISLRRFSQEDFLHYKLQMAVLSSTHALDPQSALSTSLQQLAEKFRRRGAAYFDSSATDDCVSNGDRVHVNVGYPRMLAACGCCFEAVTWLMDNACLFKRSSLLLLLILRACGVGRHPLLKQLDPSVAKFGYSDNSVPRQDRQREDTSSFARLVEKGLEGSSVLAKIMIMTVVPASQWCTLSRSLVARHFAVVSSPAVLGSLSADGDAIHPGLLDRVLRSSTLSPPESGPQRPGHELSEVANLSVEKKNHRLLLCLYAEIRDDGRRRRALVEAFTAAWLLRDFHSCLEILSEAFDGDVFSNFDCPPDEAERRKAKFFVAAYPLLQCCLSSREARELNVSWLQAQILWRTRQSEFHSALALFTELNRSAEPLLSLPSLSAAPWAEGRLRMASSPGIARLVDCLAYLLLRLAERGEPLHSLISHKLLIQVHEVCMALPPSASPRLSRTRATLNEFLRQYTGSECAPLVF